MVVVVVDDVVNLVSIVVSVLEMFADPTADEQWLLLLSSKFVFLVVSVLDMFADPRIDQQWLLLLLMMMLLILCLLLFL